MAAGQQCINIWDFQSDQSIPKPMQVWVIVIKEHKCRNSYMLNYVNKFCESVYLTKLCLVL